MKTFILKRISQTTDRTLGFLFFEQKPIAVTIEPPWKMNETSISCIPPMIYKCKRVDSPKFGNTFEVKDVYNRSSILFHKGNYVHDTYGCIILGSNFIQKTTEECGVGNSKIAYNFFMLTLELDNEFLLEILEK